MGIQFTCTYLHVHVAALILCFVCVCCRGVSHMGRVLQELVTTEKSYVHDLNDIIAVSTHTPLALMGPVQLYNNMLYTVHAHCTHSCRVWGFNSTLKYTLGVIGASMSMWPLNKWYCYCAPVVSLPSPPPTRCAGLCGAAGEQGGGTASAERRPGQGLWQPPGDQRLPQVRPGAWCRRWGHWWWRGVCK